MIIERYVFSLSKELTLGEKCDFEITSQASVSLNPITRILTNAPTRKFVSLKSIGGVELDEIFVLDKNLLTKDKQFDAKLFYFEFSYSDLGFGLTKIDADENITIIGRYSGLVPRKFVAGFKFLFCVSIIGCAIAEDN